MSLVNGNIKAEPIVCLLVVTVGMWVLPQVNVCAMLQNAYNIPTLINPTKLAHGAKRAGHECGTPACIVHNINSFCKPPNSIVGADKACINRDGPGMSSTLGTRAFKTACPDAYSYSQDDSSSTYGCKSGSDYEVVFCYEQRVAEA